MVVKRKIREKRVHDVLTSFCRFSKNGGGGVNTDSGPYCWGRQDARFLEMPVCVVF